MQATTFDFLDTNAHLNLEAGKETSEGGEPVFYFWREIVKPGNFVNTLTGVPMDFPESRIQHWESTGKQMLSAGKRIPFNQDHNLAAANGLGEVVGYKIENGVLLGKFKVVGDKAKDIFLSNGVSIGVRPLITHSGGEVWKDAIEHVAATQIPQIGGMSDPKIAASAVPFFLSSISTGDKMDGSIACSATHLAGLRGHKHLNMSSVPDSGVMEHMHGFHQKMGEHLSAIARNVPGLMDCQPGMEMSAIANHVSQHHTMMTAVKALVPNAQNLSAVDFATTLNGRVTELTNAAATIATKESTINSQAETITNLKKNAVENVSAKEAMYLSAHAKNVLDQCVKEGRLSPHVSKMILDHFVGTPEKPNTLMCSATANPNSQDKPAILELLDILKLNSPNQGLLTEMTKGQNLSYVPPGAAPAVVNDSTKAAMDAMGEFVKSNAKVA